MKIQIKRFSLLILVIAFLSLGTFAQSESSIPTNFTTYTDEVNLFSISYPANWEPAFSKIESLKQETENYMKSIDEKGFSEKSNYVFIGGVPLDNGYYNPNISILAEPLGDDNVKLEDIVEPLVSDHKRLSEEYREFFRTRTIIDGRQAIILDFEARYPNLVLVHFLVMVTVIDKFGWAITCTICPPLNFFDFKDDLYAIVKSFKILRKPNSSSTIKKGRGFENEQIIGTLYRNNQHKFRIHFPENWEIVDGDGPHIIKKAIKEGSSVSVFVMDFFEGEMDQELLNEMKREYKKATGVNISDTEAKQVMAELTADDFSDKEFEEMMKGFSGGILSKYGESKILNESIRYLDNKKALYIKTEIFSKALDLEVQMIMVNYMTFYNGKIYGVCGGSLKDDFPAIEKQINLSIASFVFENF